MRLDYAMTGGILGLFKLRWSWWPHATRKPAHVGRIGPAIKPWCIVLHTTDMLPGTFESLVNSWTTRQGKGQCAHFLIGRNFAEGTIQFAPINRNANHAGGSKLVEGKWVPDHGWFVVGGKRVHPNTVSVGIEIHNAGQLRLIDGQWRSWDYDKKQPQGAAFDSADVEIDVRRPTRGWHKMTEWQRTELAALISAIEGQMQKMPNDVSVETNGPQIHPWATVRDFRIVGHVTLDPERKTDPGPEVMREFAR
jgi:hypothetical protein